MASKSKQAAKAAKAAKGSITSFSPSDVADVVTANPYIQRLVSDAELRDNVKQAVDRSRALYDHLTSSRTTLKSLVEDKKLQKEIRETAEAVREVVEGLTDGPVKHAAKKGGASIGRVLVLGGVGGGAALAASGGLRSKVLDALFGKEEEFNYTPPAATPPAPTAAPTAA